jgi:hydrogen peroxide-dependent heme synthase
VELDLAQTELYDFLELRHSYVSVVELGLYESSRKTYEAAAAKGFEPHTPEWNAEIAASLERGADAMARGSSLPFPRPNTSASIPWTASAASR